MKNKLAQQIIAAHLAERTQPKTGQPCTCKPGRARDNCRHCEGTGLRVDFAAIRASTAAPKPTAQELAWAVVNQIRTAYANGKRNGDSMNWNDVDAAFELANSAHSQAKREASGAKQLARLDKMDKIHSTGNDKPHSPLPFSEDPEGELEVGIEDAKGRVICYASTQDAPFIVTACNSHAALTESLKDLLTILPYYENKDAAKVAGARAVLAELES